MSRPPEPVEPLAAPPPHGVAEGPVPAEPLSLWAGYGVEVEFMIVDADSLDVRPVADRLFDAVAQGADGAGEEDDPEAGGDDPVVEGVGWSNELALHVLELKTPGPVPGLSGLAEAFARSLERAEELLEPWGCAVLPGAVHPWMDPVREFRIWPRECTEVYRTFDRIFGCRGHGWANLQSTHLNLPFHGDEEFGLLHEAVRCVLPLIPALTAASPILDGRVTGALDSRLLAYRDNARRVPQVTGSVVPEAVDSRTTYHRIVLEPIYQALEPLDPEGVLRHEWVNARGAIARFDRGSIEIRVVDAQEGPVADLAVVAAVAGAVRRAAEVLEAEPELRGRWATDPLADLLDRTAQVGRRARPERLEYRALLGLEHPVGDAGEIWGGLLEEVGLLESGGEWQPALRAFVDHGSLAERLLAELSLRRGAHRGDEVPRPRLRDVWRRLQEGLGRREVFGP